MRGQTYSLLDNDKLGANLTLRRFGHDFIVEVSSSVRRGEGGSSLSFNLRPRLGYNPSRLGFLEY